MGFFSKLDWRMTWSEFEMADQFFFPSIKIIFIFWIPLLELRRNRPLKQCDIHCCMRSLSSVATSRFPHLFMFWKYLCVAKEAKLYSLCECSIFYLWKSVSSELKIIVDGMRQPVGDEAGHPHALHQDGLSVRQVVAVVQAHLPFRTNNLKNN